MDLESALKQLGLKQSEIDVYLALLKTGETSISKLSEVAKIHKKNIYEAADRLVNKGLVSSVIKSNVTYWTPLSPENLFALLDEKKSIIEKIMPELMSEYSINKSTRTITTYDDKEGIRSFLNDIIKEDKQLRIIAGTGKGFDKTGFYIYSWFKKINEQKINISVLFNHDANIKNILKETTNINCSFLPKEFTTPTQLFIYGNKTGIVMWSQRPLAIVIENEEITKGFEQYYNFLEKISSKKVPPSKNKLKK